MVFFNLHPLPCILIAVVILASQFTEQVSYLNPHILPTVVKSIRGFEFNRYFDFVANPYTRASVDGAGKKTVVLQGVNVKWVFDLEVNKDLFSPLYQYYDTNFQPQTSNLRDCYYHVYKKILLNSFSSY
ncbi:hypothetical protein HMI54_008118 [Coelomomyces lativittatus]|nr:hypothetical protein HMI54_008118 [Coelomomyces lativittatus]KAJ1510476.1 hypothetical protein HMI56_006324 [Coelomomyces lativittatus]